MCLMVMLEVVLAHSSSVYYILSTPILLNVCVRLCYILYTPFVKVTPVSVKRAKRRRHVFCTRSFWGSSVWRPLLRTTSWLTQEHDFEGLTGGFGENRPAAAPRQEQGTRLNGTWLERQQPVITDWALWMFMCTRHTAIKLRSICRAARRKKKFLLIHQCWEIGCPGFDPGGFHEATI